MKKTFLLKDEKKDQNRILDDIKHNIRKYIKREKRKSLPDGSDFWKIDCKFGQDVKTAQEIKFEDIISNISNLTTQDWDSFYIELTSTAASIIAKKKEIIEAEIKEETQKEVAENEDADKTSIIQNDENIHKKE